MRHSVKRSIALGLVAATTMSMMCIPAFGSINSASTGDGLGSGNKNLNVPIVQPVNKLPEEEQLKKVTASVKKTLDLDDSYTDFYGEPYISTFKKLWNLNWSKDGENLYVQATDTGKIVRYSRDIDESAEKQMMGYIDKLRYNPKFSDNTIASDKAAMNSFLDKVLAENETVKLNEDNTNTYGTETRFYGNICLNGVYAPMSLRVVVENGIVTEFNRTDTSDYPGKIDSVGNIALQASDEIKEKLKGPMDFDIEWKYDAETKQARLVYIPKFENNYFVDALTGKLVDKGEIQDTLDKNFSGAGNVGLGTDSEADEGSIENSLTEAEISGAEKIKDMLAPEKIDEILKSKYKELGIESKGLIQADSRYTLNNETGDIEAVLVYSKKDGNRLIKRTITVDGKTGEFKEIWGNRAGWEKEIQAVNKSKAQQVAEDFINKVYAKDVKGTKLYSSTDADKVKQSENYRFTFVTYYKGYFLPTSQITVEIDRDDFTVVTAYNSITQEVSYNDISNMIDVAKAKDIWLNSFDTSLSYVPVPVAINLLGPDYLPLDINYKDIGINYVSSLKLGYELREKDRHYTNIDAVTGELGSYYWIENNENIEYSDLEGNEYAKEFTRLADMGIGYIDGKSTGNLTQLDMLILIASASERIGGVKTELDEDEINSVYYWGYLYGALEPSEKQPNKQLTNIEAIKLLVNTLGYKRVAEMNSIYSSEFNGNNQGYVALAKGLGIITDSKLDLNGQATRQTGLMALYNFMSNNK